MPQFNYQTGQMEETEEERRAREAASDPNTNIGPVEPTPIKETRTIDPATGEVELTIKGNERDLSAANTNTPTYTGARAPAPVAPDDTFKRMIQVESGGRQTDAQGRVLTSNKGAMGIAQVMPTTAMDPGYGVKNIFDLAQERGIPFQNRDLATAKQLLGNRALNQEFGQNYYAAMNRRFDGGPGAVAAYNAGPGRVSQNMARNQGQLNVGQLPQETQGYLQKVGMPTPAQRPPQPVSPEQLAQQPMPANQGINPQRPGLQIPGLTALSQMGQPAAPAPNPTEQAISRYQAIQDKPDELMKFAFDTNANTPDYLKQRAKDQLVQSYDSQKKESEATKVIPSMNQNDIARAMTKKSEGNSVGDWVQYLLFRHVGLTDLANQKGEQLGIGHQWTRSSIIDDAGNAIPIELQTTASGKLLGGNMLDGTPLTREQLNQTGASLGKGTSLSAEVYIDPATGKRYRSGYDSSGKAAYVSMSGGPAFRGDEKRLQIQSVGTAAQKAENAAAISLRYAGPMSFNKAAAGEAGKFSQENGVKIGYATDAPGAPLMDLNTGKQVVPDANGNITITKNGGGTMTVATGGAPAQTAPAPAAAASEQYGPPAPRFRQDPGFTNESPAAFTARSKAWQETYKTQYADAQKNLKTAKELLPDVAKMKKLIDQSTGSGFGAMVDATGNFFGYSTAGADAIAAIAPLANQVLMGVQRFEGPQSDMDVKSYKEAAGRLADNTIPPSQKQAAFNTILEIMKRRAPDLDWDKALSSEVDQNNPLLKKKK